MLFNSPEFIFLFVPAAVALHFFLARFGVMPAVIGTTVSSLFFYAVWNPPYVVLPVLSILANFWIAQCIVQAEKVWARPFFIGGIAANLAVLSYYKYWDFLLSIVDGHKAVPPNVPLALSFTTFVQIAFLVYVYQRRELPQFRFYALFVAFFPHLIAGPIVRWGSLGSQLLDKSRYRFNWDNAALGLTIFVFGLAKKVLIADTLALHAGPVFDAAAHQELITALAAWLGCFGFALQMYFDFSGYSDMAIGLGLLFNFKLPINFAAPLRSTSMIDLWRRWHMTLSRLARDLIYVPLAAGHESTIRRSASLMLTMVVIGVWHGAGWTFVAWGAFHGVAVLINQAWHWLRGLHKPTQNARVLGWAVTFTVFASSAVFFRAPDIESSWYLIKAMSGFGRVATVSDFPLEWDSWLIRHDYASRDFVLTWLGTTWSVVGTLWLLVALLVMCCVPDTLEIVNYREGDAQSRWRRNLGRFAWRPSWPWALAVIVLFAVVLTRIGQVSEFLYYQF
jgi:D-alanyl-lipoteichoic acid acyltransferase DltB (MBOAT superfamily)